MAALIEAGFAFLWFGWGQATAGGTLPLVLMAGSALAVPVAIIGAARAITGSRAGAVLHDRAAGRRYGIIVGIEFGACGLGAVVLALTGQSAYLAALICLVVGLHFVPLAPVLRDRRLIVLGALLTAVGLAAAACGLAGAVAPSTVAGLGAGVLLVGSAVLTLARPAPVWDVTRG